MKFTKLNKKVKNTKNETTIKDYVMVRATITYPIHVSALNDEYGVGSYLQCAADDWLENEESDITVVETSPITIKDLQDFAKTVDADSWYIATQDIFDNDGVDSTITELINLLSKKKK